MWQWTSFALKLCCLKNNLQRFCFFYFNVSTSNVQSSIGWVFQHVGSKLLWFVSLIALVSDEMGEDKKRGSRDRSRDRDKERRRERSGERRRDRSRSPKDKKKTSKRRKPSLYWDVPPPGFEHITPMQYKSWVLIWEISWKKLSILIRHKWKWFLATVSVYFDVLFLSGCRLRARYRLLW